MKKSFSFFVVWLLAIMCSAQIHVSSTGNVCIGDTSLYDAKLFVDAIGSNNVGIFSMTVKATPETAAIYGMVRNATQKQIAVYGDALNSSAINTGRSYGVYGVAGNRAAGYNYGVYGELSGNSTGTAIYGTIYQTTPQINGRYAGFFYGNAYVTGTLTAGNLTTLSDARYKSNIQQISTTALSKIASLNPVQYTMLSGNAIALANTEPTDTTTTMIMTTSNEDLSQANQIHYGLLAQEVKELYPELVHEDDAGVMSINYIELIPLLIQAVQDLSEQVNALSNGASAAY